MKESVMKKLLMLITVMLLGSIGYGYYNEPASAPPIPDANGIADANLLVGSVWDLKYHWSDTDNPNGVWSYGGGGAVGDPLGTNGHGDFVLLSTYSYNQHFAGQDGWGWVPCVSKAMDPGIASTAGYDIQAGDIYGHGPFMVRWTAPVDMRIMVTGNAWRLRDQAETHLYLLENGDWNNNTAAQRHDLGSLFVTIYPRSVPLDFGPIILDVIAGQLVTLFLDGNDFTAVNMTLEVVSADNAYLTLNTNPSYVDTTVPQPGVITYPVGSVATLQANTYLDCPNNGEVLVFDSWIGDVADPLSPSTTITLNSDQTVIANYVDGRQCGDDCHPYPQYDYTEDCIVNVADLSEFASGWLECTQPACD